MREINLDEAFKRFKDTGVVVVFDHGRAGNLFFQRIFDQHPEVLSITSIGYFYSILIDIFKNKDEISGSYVYGRIIEDSNFKSMVADMSPQVAQLFHRLGDSPDCVIDRAAVRRILTSFIKNKPVVTRKDVTCAIHLAYAVGTGRDLEKIRYLLLNESPCNYVKDGNKRNSYMFKIMKQDNQTLRIIHLLRDPRASFASIRHQYVNQHGNMYPLRAKRIWQTTGTNSVWLWVLSYTIAGAREMFKWQIELGDEFFYRVKNEDLNLNFVETMEKLIAWLRVDWYESWSWPDYIPTSGGLPWKGISAYCSGYQKNTQGPIINEPAGKDRFSGPNREVTERWKRRLYKREIKFLEAVYYDEMIQLNYDFMYVHEEKQRLLAMLWIILPLAGEIPRIEWWLSRERIKNKIAFLCMFPFSYVLARITFFVKYYLGEFSLSEEKK